MRPFDLATWAAIVILVLGSLAIFLWFLKDAGRVLRGEGKAPPRGPTSRPRSGTPRRPPGAGRASSWLDAPDS